MSLKNKNVFFKFLLSYIAILLIPIVIISFLVNYSFLSILEKETTTNNINTLNKLKYVIDNQVLGLEKICAQMYFEENLKALKLEDDPYKAFIARKELRKFLSSNSFFDDIILYFNNSNYLYSSKGSYSVDYFLSLMSFKDWDKNEFLQDINENSSLRIKTKLNSSSKFKIFIYPIFIDGYSSKETVLFMIDEKKFQDLIKNNFEMFDATTVILDNNNNIISKSQDFPYVDTAEFKELIKSSPAETSKKLELDGKDYILSVIKSEDTKWSYATLIPTKYMMENVNTAKKQFLTALILIFIISSIFIHRNMYMNYRPINELIKSSEEIYSNIESNSSNGIEFIGKTINYLKDENSNLISKINDTKLAQREYLLLNLIQGKVNSLEQFNKDGTSINIKFDYPNFMVAIIYMPKINLKEIGQNDLINFIEESFKNYSDVNCYSKNIVDKNKLVVVLSLKNDDKSFIEEVFSMLHHDIKNKFELPITIGIGKVYKDILDFPKSYMDAYTAVDYRLIKGNDNIIFFDSITNQSNVPLKQAYKYLDMIKLSLNDGKAEEFEKHLDELISLLKEENSSLFVARYLCFEVFNTMVTSNKFLSKKNMDKNLIYPDVFSLTEFETIDELSETLKGLYVSAFKSKDNLCKKSNLNIINDMIKYIEENYTQYNFSVQDMSEYFKMSLPALSQFFKDNTGISVLDYVTNLKMEKAKKLIISTDMSLKDISFEVGYYNLSSFIRRFKQINGITPGEYRKINKKV